MKSWGSLRNSIFLLSLLVGSSCNIGCMILPKDCGGLAMVESCLWDGRSAPSLGPGQSLADLLRELSISPSPEGNLREIPRVVVLPFFFQNLYPDDGETPKRKYDLLAPVVLTGSKKTFRYPMRLSCCLWIYPMTVFPRGYSPPDVSAVVFAEGAWPVYTDWWGGGGGRLDKAESAWGPKFVIRTVHQPRKQALDWYVAGRAGCGEYPPHLLEILGQNGNRLLRLVDKSSALSDRDRLTIYLQLADLLDGALNTGKMLPFGRPLKLPSREPLEKVLSELQQRTRQLAPQEDLPKEG